MENNLAELVEIQPWEQVIDAEMDWFEEEISRRLDDRIFEFEFDDAPDLSKAEGHYAKLVNDLKLNKEERALLMLLYFVHAAPDMIDELAQENYNFYAFQKSSKGGKTPTAETFLKILAGKNRVRRRKYSYLFDSRHPFYQEGILRMSNTEEGVNQYNRIISLDTDYVDLFTENEYRIPQFSPEFPATLAKSNLTMKDIHLTEVQANKLLEIKAEVVHAEKIRKDLGYENSMTPGYVALFYGEPGTGKTLTAATLGNELGMEVFEVNVSHLVSKFVGETTKNLDRLLKKAAGKGWILVFNEADCLFGKRSHANGDDDAGTSHANQTISYLLDAIPRHKGIIILTTNMRHNFDKAFGRRISSEIHFKPLDTEEATNYLKGYIHPDLPLEKYDNLNDVLKRQCQAISIASLNNIVHRATRIALIDEGDKIKIPVFEGCLKDEVYKTNN